MVVYMMMWEWLATVTSSMMFALGLVISGMINPKKIIDFLDITGQWDPSLLFVMAGAIGVNVILFHTILKKSKPLLAENFSLPLKDKLDSRLMAGSIIFGIGWGMTGICPGPAVVNIISGHNKIFIYLAGMILGMLLFEAYNKFSTKKKD